MSRRPALDVYLEVEGTSGAPPLPYQFLAHYLTCLPPILPLACSWSRSGGRVGAHLRVRYERKKTSLFINPNTYTSRPTVPTEWGIDSRTILTPTKSRRIPLEDYRYRQVAINTPFH